MKCPGCGWEVGPSGICENCLFDANAPRGVKSVPKVVKKKGK